MVDLLDQSVQILHGPDVVQCAALVGTDHGIVNLIMNMVKDTPSIPLDRLSGSKTQLMIGLSKLVGNWGSTLLMAMLCPWCAQVASCTFFSLENPHMRL